jgi:hypothetical protein
MPYLEPHRHFCFSQTRYRSKAKSKYISQQKTFMSLLIAYIVL